MSEIDSIVQGIKAELQDDLVSAGWLMQAIRKATTTDCMEQVICRLLSDGVEIGIAVVEAQYVKFIAWNGSVEKRCQRARHEQQLAEERDQDFAFWLCLRANVDEHERNSQNQPDPLPNVTI